MGIFEGGVDEAGVFHQIPRMDDARLAGIFAREVLAFLVGKELVSSEWAERLLSWQHTGFSVHSLVRAKTKPAHPFQGLGGHDPEGLRGRPPALSPVRQPCSTHSFHECGAMKIVAFLTDFTVVDRIIDHLKLTFVAERPPPPQGAPQELLMAADVSAEYFS